MEKKNWTAKKILRTFDFFGESFTFRYKDEDKHSTILGGIICICFYIIAISYFIYNFIPFYHRENFSLQYYTMNLNNTEKIKLHESPTAFAFGLTDENDNTTSYNIYDLLDLKIIFRIVAKNNIDSGTKRNETLDFHQCNIDNFHNLHNKSFHELNINNFYCVNKDDLLSPQGIYTDEIFSYFAISVLSKYKDNETHNQIINDYLLEHDCKLQFFYTDIAIDINNLKNPFSSFLNSMFLQLNPTLIQKKNVFFMNYHLLDDNLFFHVKKEKEKPVVKTGLSRVEDYSVYKGLDRAARKAEDYAEYAKLYIRADNKKIEIKRRYQDFMEFYADTSALLLSIFWILGNIFAYYDRIKANHSISKKLFYFEGIKNNKFQQFKKFKDFINKNEKLQSILEKNIIFSNLDSNNFLKDQIQRRDTDSQLTNNVEENEEDLIDYTNYNIFEMLLSFQLFYCKSKKFESKINLIKKANEIIDDKLDIIYYVRNLILFEIINKIYLENKTIINFLSRPIIYINEDNGEKIENDIETNISYEDISEDKSKGINDLRIQKYLNEDDLYKTVYKLNSDNLSKKIEKLIIRQNKTEKEKKLINFLKIHLNGV